MLYRVPAEPFYWGSNSVFANMGIAMVYAYILTGDSLFIRAASEVTDYLLGRNATTYSFLTGFGAHPPMFPHHRPSVAAEAQTAGKPVPGLIVGGPNSSKQDARDGVTYLFTEPARSYMDVYASYASNEVAINWSSPVTFLLAAVDHLLSGERGDTPIRRFSVEKRSALKNDPGIKVDGVSVSFTLAAPARVELTVVDLRGRTIAHRATDVAVAGEHRIRYHGEKSARGAAIVVLSVDGRCVAKKSVAALY
jgi:endoglucanase